MLPQLVGDKRHQKCSSTYFLICINSNVFQSLFWRCNPVSSPLFLLECTGSIYHPLCVRSFLSFLYSIFFALVLSVFRFCHRFLSAKRKYFLVLNEQQIVSLLYDLVLFIHSNSRVFVFSDIIMSIVNTLANHDESKSKRY